MKKLTTDEWVSIVKKTHGDQYVFDDRCHYDGRDSKVTILCKRHGYFDILASSFKKGFGCPLCAKEKNTLSEEDFIKKAQSVHGGKYKYIYSVGCKDITVICPIHGAFSQNKFSHLKGCGCMKCSLEAKKNVNRDDIDEIRQSWVDKFRKVHGDRYDYSKFEFVNASTNAVIICPEHGEFLQTPYAHSKGHKCPRCSEDELSKRFSFTKDRFIEKAREIHGDKYEYVGEYRNMKEKIKVICPEHGEFEILAKNHIYNRQGCPECGRLKSIKSNTETTTESYIERCKNVHGDKYDYSITEFRGWKKDIKYICHRSAKSGKEHGVITQNAGVHLYMGCGCPKCAHINSKAEDEIADMVKSHYDIIRNSRSILPSGKELDIYIPELRTAIEYNGMRWHSDAFEKDKNSHYDKLNECIENGIKLITVFEYEYIVKNALMWSKLKHLLKIHDENEIKGKIYARKCIVKEIDKKAAGEFLEMNHIQGSCGSTVSLGCIYDGLLVGVMSFVKRDKKRNAWELVRFATDNNYICCGVGGKMFKYFLSKYRYSSIVSFADRRWTINDDNLYTKLGFRKICVTRPDYRYTKESDKYIHKFCFRKKTLNRKYGFPLTMTESEMASELGYSKIWNCGLIKYVYS